ncbi:MAG: acyltransferase family protein, partial [Burkholderiaceae bacterium]|nr:acyltransferase family protein [Burkholderiaceae bacterium]
MTPALSVYLDALRLLAALMVFAHHASYPIFGGRWISALGGYGHEAVVVFFVLSGFVIAFVTDVKERTPAAYAGSRLSRLWSVALPALAATLAMDAIGRQLAPQAYADVLVNPQGPLASALFVNEFWTAQWHVGSNIPFWSLSYEAAYYLLFGIFVFAPMRWLWLAAAAALIGPKILLLAPAWVAGVVAYRAA